MWQQPQGTGWGERFIGLVVTIFIVILAVQALIIVIAPWLPWIGLAVIGAAASGLFARRRDRW